MSHVNPVWRVQACAIYADTGAQGTGQIGTTAVLSSGFLSETIEAGVQYRMRFLVQEIAGATTAAQPVLNLVYRKSTDNAQNYGGNTYVSVGTDGFVACTDNQVWPGDTVTQVLGSGTLNDGVIRYNEGSTDSTLAATNGNDEYEFELVFSIDDGVDHDAEHFFYFYPEIDNTVIIDEARYGFNLKASPTVTTFDRTAAITSASTVAASDPWVGVPFSMNITTVGADEVFTIPCVSNGSFDATIEWGDGSSSVITAFDDAALAHTYSGAAATYDIRVLRQFANISFDGVGTSKDRVNSVIIGSVGWRDFPYSFSGCSNLTSADWTGFFTDDPLFNDFRGVFQDCTSLASIDMSMVDTSTVTTVYQMFRNCSSLTSLDVTDWDTSIVTDMRNFVEGCSSLAAVTGIEAWNVSSATTMRFMFSNTAITTIDLSSWTTTALTGNGLEYMFSNTENLTSVTFGASWDTSSVTSFFRMFFSIDTSPTVSCPGIENFSVAGVVAGAGNGLDDFMTASALARADYDAWLINMEATAGTPPDAIIADFNQTKYTGGGAAATARGLLISRDGWTITDLGPVNAFDRTAAIVSASTVSATAARTESRSATIGAASAFTATAVKYTVLSRAAAFASASTVTATAATNTTYDRVAAFSDVSTFAATAVTNKYYYRVAAFSDVSTFSAAGTLDVTMSADVNTFALTGIDATFPVALVMPATVGPFTLTGVDAAFQRAIILDAITGSVALTGVDATFLLGKSLPVTVGAFAVAGVSVEFPVALVMPTTVGTFALAGSDIAEAYTFLFMRPDADNSVGAWQNEVGATTGLWASIGETVRDDGTYVRSELAPAASEYRVRLSDPGDFVNPDGPHALTYVIGKSSANTQMDATVYLEQGAAVIASQAHVDLPVGPALSVMALTAPQKAAITDYNDLFLRFQVSQV